MDETTSLLVAYVDGELDEARAREVEALIAVDPQAREMVRVYRETARLLRSAYDPEDRTMPVAPKLPAAANQPRLRRVGWLAGAALAAGVLGFVGGASWATWPKLPVLAFASEVAEYHEVFAREDRHLVEVPAAELGELTQWLGARLGRRLDVPDLAREGLHFAGARMLVVDGRPVAQLMYTRTEGTPIALCITKLEGVAGPIREERFGTQATASWQDGAYGFVVVGDVDPTALRVVADDAARQLPAS